MPLTKSLAVTLCMTNNSFFAFEIQQDTLNLVRPKSNQNRTFQINFPVEKLQIDPERAQEVIEQTEQREQQIIAEKRRIFVPKIEPLRKPSIEVDSLMAKYQHIGCSPHTAFPDTFTLTILERYYQPMTATLPSLSIVDTTRTASLANIDTTNPLTASDNVSVISPAPVSTTSVPTTGFAGKIRTEDYPSMVTVFLMCELILLTCIKFYFGKNLLQAFLSFFNYQQARRMFEERRESDKQAALFSNILFSFVTGIFLSFVLPFFGAPLIWGSYTLSIVFFSLAVGLLYMIKAGVWKMFGVVFMTQSFSQTYVYNMFLYNRNIGLFIFPLVAIIPYVTESVTPYVIYGVFVIFGISYLLKVWRIFQIIHEQNASVYHFILYLCTLEILPVLLFVKVCKVLNDCLIM